MKYILLLVFFFFSCKKELSYQCPVIVSKEMKGIGTAGGASKTYIYLSNGNQIQVGLLQYERLNIGDKYCP